ncbi:MAG: hypothetical protein HZC18_08705 [Candidatus Omnitrophica bacterium]|nr:hypothetical protein [Candidatus Omnitrophota bacterium]
MEPFLFEELIKRSREFGITVADQDSFPGDGQILGDRFKLVKNPLLVGAFGDTGDINPAGFDVDEKEDVKSLFAEDRPDGLGKKVAGPEGIEGAFEIVGEGIPGADAGCRDAVFNQDIFNSGFADRDFEFFEFGKDFGIAPFGTAGHGDDEDADVAGKDTGTAAFFCRRSGRIKVTHPAAESGVMDDGENLFDPAAQGHAEFEQEVLFSQGKRDVRRQFGAEDLIFGTDKLKLLDQFVVGHLGEKGEELVGAHKRPPCQYLLFKSYDHEEV